MVHIKKNFFKEKSQVNDCIPSWGKATLPTALLRLLRIAGRDSGVPEGMPASASVCRLFANAMGDSPSNSSMWDVQSKKVVYARDLARELNRVM